MRKPRSPRDAGSDDSPDAGQGAAPPQSAGGAAGLCRVLDVGFGGLQDSNTKEADLRRHTGTVVVKLPEDTNGSQSSTPQSVHKYKPASQNPARAVSDQGTPASVDGSGALPINQITCAENAHRQQKSENHAQELLSPPLAAAVTGPSGVAPLTRELSQQHDRLREADCKDTGKKRRPDELEDAAAATPAKMARSCAELQQEGGIKGNSVGNKTEFYQAPEEQMRPKKSVDFDNDEGF
ncbi:hypothetical protein AAVH_12213 [Aphelenchoides avenae]|nr:hypothetical protein AAVH_12213 [Aphelenchus avenae]